MYGIGWTVVRLRNFHVGMEPRNFDEVVPRTRTNSRVFGLVSSIFTLGGRVCIRGAFGGDPVVTQPTKRKKKIREQE